MGCGGSYEGGAALDKPLNLHDVVDYEEQPGAVEEDLEQEGEVSHEPEVSNEPQVKEQTPLPEVSAERDPQHIFTIKFKKKPLGISLTSSIKGFCAYVSQVNGKKNKAVKKNKLPLKSKLLKVNGKDIEMDKLDNIIVAMVEGLKKLPMELTFRHPDGLGKGETADPNPTDN